MGFMWSEQVCFMAACFIFYLCGSVILSLGNLLMGSAAGFSHSSVLASPLGLSLVFWDRREDIVAAVTTALKLRFLFCTLSSGWKMMMYTLGI